MKNMDNPIKLQKEILKKTYLIALLPIVSALITGAMDVLLGFVFGLVISTLLLRLKYNNIRRALKMDEEKAEKFIRNRYFIEYAMYLIVLFTAARNQDLNFLAAAVGLFMMKFTVILWTILDLFKDSIQQKLESYK